MSIGVYVYLLVKNTIYVYIYFIHVPYWNMMTNTLYISNIHDQFHDIVNSYYIYASRCNNFGKIDYA